MPSRQHRIADAPPNDAAVTVYDRNHLKLYMRLNVRARSTTVIYPALVG